MNNDEKGFSVVEVLVVVVIAGLISAVGWLILDRQKSSTGQSSTTSNSTQKDEANNDQYADWQTSTLKYEKASFKYPADWKLTDTSFQDDGSTQGGVDVVRLTGANGFQLSIIDGGPNDYGLPFGGATILDTDTVTFLGKKNYLLLWQAGQQNTGMVGSINLSTSLTDVTAFPDDKNVDTTVTSGVSTKQNKFVITMAYYPDENADGQSKSIQKPLASVTADKNYANAQLVLQSMAY